LIVLVLLFAWYLMEKNSFGAVIALIFDKQKYMDKSVNV
jgi:hypothetical protein